MTTHKNDREIREVVGVFDSPKSLQSAIDDLMESGFDHSEISLLAAPETVDRTIGNKLINVAEIEDEWVAPRTHYVSPESIGDARGALISLFVYVGALATAGALVAWGVASANIVAGAALAGGFCGLIGFILARILGRRHARYLAEQLARGGLLVWVRAWDSEHERRAIEIFSKNSGHDVHVHDMHA